MESIVVVFKDGKQEKFEHRGRAGGSYTISIRYEGGFAIVKNEWGDTTSFPSENIDRIETKEDHRW